MIAARKFRIAGVGAVFISAAMLGVALLAGGWSKNDSAAADGASGNLDTERDFGNQNRSLPVAVIRIGDIEAPIRADDYRGTLQPSKQAELAFRRSGKIQQIIVDEGAQVFQGETLARLDISDLQAVIEATEARVDEAEALLAELVEGPRVQTVAAAAAEVQRLEASVELAKVTAARESELQRSNASSAQSYDDARFSTRQQLAALESAKQRLAELEAGTRTEQLTAQRARLAILQAELKGYQVDLKDCEIVAPFDGVISKRYVDEGIIAGSEKLVLRLIKINPLEARFGLAPEDVRGLLMGQTLKMIVGHERIQGVVSNIEPEVDLATRTQAVLVSIPRLLNDSESNIQDGVVVGRTVSLSLEKRPTQDDDTYWVPITALARSTRGLWSVMVVTADPDATHRLERRDVQVREIDTRLARIAGGMIQKGDQIVCDGLHRVTPGMLVEPMLTATGSR